MAQTSMDQIRAWQGPALFSFGFRPFFLGATIWVVLAMALWVAALSGALLLPTRLDPVSWHAHEFLFGYLGAVLAGFLLTAVPNWTGRLPLVGWPLAGLFGLWGAGRLAVLFSAYLPIGLAPIVDLSFPLVLAFVILREIVAGKNWHNLLVFGLLMAFTLSNALFHAEVAQGSFAAQGPGLRAGLATAIMMISVIGGRIIPSFTRNWLAKQGKDQRPSPPMQRFDKAVLAATLAGLLLWVVHPEAGATGSALLALGVLHVARLARWQGHLTGTEPLVWVLHLSYACIPLGAFAMGAAILGGGSGQVAAQHLWMAGAIGAMTLGVMTRATLGHCGKPLHAGAATLALYLALFGAVMTRLAAGEFPALINLSAGLWLCAYAGFAFVYGSLLLRPRIKG